MSIDRLRELINRCPGDTHDDRIKAFALIVERTRSTVYQWLTNGVSEKTLDSAEFRLDRL